MAYSLAAQNNLHNMLNLSHLSEDNDCNIYACQPEHLSDDEIAYELKLRQMEVPQNVRAQTAALSRIILQERKEVIAIPTENLLMPETEITECARKIGVLDNFLRDVQSNRESDVIFMSRYIHVLNRLKRVPHTENQGNNEEKDQLIEKMKQLRNTFGDIMRFRPPPRMNRSVIQSTVPNDTATQNENDGMNVTIENVSQVETSTSRVVSNQNDQVEIGSSTSRVDTGFTDNPNVPTAQNNVEQDEREHFFNLMGNLTSNNSNVNPTAQPVASSVNVSQPVQHNISMSEQGANINMHESSGVNDQMNFANAANFTQRPSTINQSFDLNGFRQNSLNFSTHTTQGNFGRISSSAVHPNFIGQSCQPDFGRTYPIVASTRPPQVTQNVDRLTKQPTFQGNFQRNRTTFVPINKWGIKFQGKPNDNVNNLIIFMNDVKLRQRMYGISDDELFANFIVLLDGQAKMWYLAHINEFNTWTELCEAMHTKYIGKMQHSFFLSIANRKQTSNESIGEYFADMMLKMASLTDINEQRQIDMLLNGLLPRYRVRVTGFTWISVSQLEQFLTNIEADYLAHPREENRNFSRPYRREYVSAIQEAYDTDLNESMETSFDGVNESVSCCELNQQKSLGLKSKPFVKTGAATATNSATVSDSSKLVAKPMKGKCYKCGLEGHLFRQCTKQRARIFCFNCGEDNENTEASETASTQSKNVHALACEHHAH